MHWLSGQGHHFAWRIDRRSEAFGQLAQLGCPNESLCSRYQQPGSLNSTPVGLELGSAFSGLGMVLEFVAQEIKQQCQAQTPVPVAITAVEAGPVRQSVQPQREVISLDISEYGDPLDVRGIRMPFSVYLKPNQKRCQLGDPFVDAMPPIFPIPLFEMDIATALETMRDSRQVMELAGRASTAIPEFSESMLAIIERYRSSKLARFHADFFRDKHDPPEQWQWTYDKTPLDKLPSCVRLPMEQPDESMLKPAVIQLITRTLMALDWSPRHIAGLIRSKYERDFGWGDRWYRYDAASRADFYVRIFAGSIVAGYDQLADFNCVSTQEKHLCPVIHCGNNLLDLRETLARKLK